MKYQTLKLTPEDIRGKYDFDVNAEFSTKVIKASDTVVRVGNSWLFPEVVQVYNHNDEYLYAFGQTRVWRTQDAEQEWELVK